MGEFELIRHVFAAASCAQAGEGVALGIGDDCALLDVPAGQQLAISTDTLVAGVHFADPCDPFLWPPAIWPPWARRRWPLPWP